MTDQNDFQKQLKALGRAARAERLAEEARRAEEARAAKNRSDDALDFARAMQGVTPLKPDNRFVHPRDKSPIKVRRGNEYADDTEYFYVGDDHTEPPPSFSKNGRGADDVRRLQAKHWPIVGYVDLHGCRRDEAQEILNEFIDYVRKRGVVGEIVHGSGLGSKDYEPVLKNTVRRWLMEHPDVLAYAQPHERNDGAVYVLLKKRRSREED